MAKIYHFSGAGNDFVVLDGRREDLSAFRDAAEIGRLCREYSTDGLMILSVGAPGEDFTMEFYNPDGSSGMMCGNGGRCIAAFADLLGIQPGGHASCASIAPAGAAAPTASASPAAPTASAGPAAPTASAGPTAKADSAGPADPTSAAPAAKAVSAGPAVPTSADPAAKAISAGPAVPTSADPVAKAVSAGPADPTSADPADPTSAAAVASATGAYLFRAADGLHTAEILSREGSRWVVRLGMKDVDGVTPVLGGYFLDTGTRHFVKFVPDVEAVDIASEGPALRHAPEFAPAGANVNFVQLLPGGGIKVRTFEKGVEGETLACGTGITASALASAFAGLLAPLSTAPAVPSTTPAAEAAGPAALSAGLQPAASPIADAPDSSACIQPAAGPSLSAADVAAASALSVVDAAGVAEAAGIAPSAEAGLPGSHPTATLQPADAAWHIPVQARRDALAVDFVRDGAASFRHVFLTGPAELL